MRRVDGFPAEVVRQSLLYIVGRVLEERLAKER